MATITVSLPVDDSTAEVADYNTPITTIVNEINGGLDSNNLADNAVTTAKITDATITSAKLGVNACTANDGWISTSDTWTYASASTFTVAGDKTAIFTSGTKVKWTQTTVKYGVVVSSTYGAPNTTVTIAVNTDFVIANAAISGTAYSYAALPQGFTDWFNYSPTMSGWSSNPTGGLYKYKISGKDCTIQIVQPNNGTSNATTCSFTIPATAKTQTDMAWNGSANLVDNNVSQAAAAVMRVLSGGTTVVIAKDYGFNVQTNSGNKRIPYGQITYEIA